MSADTIERVNPDFIFQQARQQRNNLLSPQRRKEEWVGYWRRPTHDLRGRPLAQAGWIIIADTQQGKRDAMLYRGFEPLNRFGRVHAEGESQDARLYRQHGRWAAILSRKGGPEQFPVDQIIQFRWYHPERIGTMEGAAENEGTEPMPFVRFPQLAQAAKEGLKIREYICPECSAVDYISPNLLARHLRNAHNWDRLAIVAWGESIGVDFRQDFAPRKINIPDYEDIDLGVVSEPETTQELAPAVEVETATVPTLAEIKAKIAACRYCKQATKGVCKEHDPDMPKADVL